MEYIERTVAWLTYNLRGRDEKLITKSAAFASHPTPTITLTSPDCGTSPATLDVDHTQDGADLLPTFTWSLPSSIPPPSVKEYLFYIEDADAPLPTPIFHAAFYGISPTKTTLEKVDLEPVIGGKANELKGGFRYAHNMRKRIYIGPRPLRGHGTHRYFHVVVALSAGLGKMSEPATREEIIRELEGKVLGWGEWVGAAERN